MNKGHLCILAIVGLSREVSLIREYSVPRDVRRGIRVYQSRRVECARERYERESAFRARSGRVLRLGARGRLFSFSPLFLLFFFYRNAAVSRRFARANQNSRVRGHGEKMANVVSLGSSVSLRVVL